VGSSSIPFFKNQVRLHPHDPAAHLNLANRYLGDGNLQLAYDQFVAALALDPHNVEALAHIGLLTAFGGNPNSGLAYENRALAVDPTYPEAMFFKGWILLKYVKRPAAAVTYLRGYLKASPYGSEGPTARKFLAEALRAAGSR